nr:immunoglobulin light chain junction region [Macaca mulatta]MOY17063.1 immunoglobulin light chain junction region [Macaca mulatta]MOY17498.1 immunoglobulin light chain junction region [Macaca mulatta]
DYYCCSYTNSDTVLF